MALRDGDLVYFYELHEGEDEVFSDVLLAHDAEYDEDEFLELVLEARGRVLDRFEEDTLGEAIARDLAARHGFLVIDDDALRVAVNVSVDEGQTFVAEVQGAPVDRDAVPSDDEYRSLLVDIDTEDQRWAG